MKGRKTKVYFSKSNASHPMDIIRANHVLRGFDIDITVFESNGHTYTHDAMRGHDYLLVLPPRLSHPHVGRGQYEQIKWALDKKMDILFIDNIITEDGEEKIVVSEVHDLAEYNIRNWTEEYGTVYHNDSWIDIINYEGFTYTETRRKGQLKQEYYGAYGKSEKEPAKRSLRLALITLFK